MTDDTAPQDDAAMSPASTGSVAERPLGDPEIAVEILRLQVAELEQVIRRLAEQDATLSVCDGNVTVTMDATLTDAEREAIEAAIDSMSGVEDISASWSQRETAAIATLRGLLERTRPDRPEAIATVESDRPQPIADARLAALQRLAELDEEFGVACTPNPHATPGECTLPPEWTEDGEK